MRAFASLPSLKTLLSLLLAGLLGLGLLSCTGSEGEETEYLDFTLSESLKDYDRVVITLVDAGDTSAVLERVFDGRLSDPAGFPRHRLGAAKGKRFIVKVRAFGADSGLAMAKDIEVVGGSPLPATVLMADLRLQVLQASQGILRPAFDPAVLGYSLDLPASQATVEFTARPMDTANRLLLDQAEKAWGATGPLSLKPGDNVFTFAVTPRGGGAARTYRVAVTRGEPSPFDPTVPVSSLALRPKSLRLYAGEPSGLVEAEVAPAGTRVYFSSLNTEVAAVDRFGNVSAVGPGTTEIIARAGDKADTASVQVIRDAPVLSVGENVTVKKGAEVDFAVVVTQERGRVVAFKYDLLGDGSWDNADSGAVPAAPLRQAYPDTGTFAARFYVRDGEGNAVEKVRTVRVTEDELLVAIVWPGRSDTAVNTPSLTVRYTVDGGPERTERFDLKEGRNPLVVRVDEGGKKGTAGLNVELDTKAPEVVITAPAPGTVTQEASVAVAWTVDGASQTTRTTEALEGEDGERAIIRAFQDAAGNVGSDTVRIVRDTRGPQPPNVFGASPTNVQPRWSWTSGGGGGNGEFRASLGDSTFAAAPAWSKDTVFTLPGTAQPGTRYTLHVQERDAAGNPSRTASREILFDNSKPVVRISAPQSSGTFVTRAATVTLRGSASGPNRVSKVAVKVNGGAAAEASLQDTAWTFADFALAEGVQYAITVVATDAAGNAGEAALAVLRDSTAPAPPAFQNRPATPTQYAKAGWTWSAGSDGANGSGLNGKYRWALNGGAWTEVASASVADLPLVEGINVFAIQEQDVAGNWSASAIHAVR